MPRLARPALSRRRPSFRRLPHRQGRTCKPEPLKQGFQGYWSRRINDEHRLIYKATEDGVLIAQCRYHYES
ncbi:Txe/YoeB family addiction module toxin [Streptomyces sp. B21-105]